jgi:hypothetical protein
MEIFDGAESLFSPKTFNNIMLSAQEFGNNSMITSLALYRDVPRRKEMYTVYYNNSTGTTEAEQSNPISSSISTHLPSRKAVYRRSQKDSTGSLKESCLNWRR